MLYLFITHILLPRVGNHTSFNHSDALMMLNIKHCVYLDFPFMKLIHMCCSSFHDVEVTLLYRMYLIKVFLHFGVDFSGEPITKFHRTHTYIYESYSRMSYTMDLTQYTYHRGIRGQDIFIYTHNTLYKYLFL